MSFSMGENSTSYPLKDADRPKPLDGQRFLFILNYRMPNHHALEHNMGRRPPAMTDFKKLWMPRILIGALGLLLWAAFGAEVLPYLLLLGTVYGLALPILGAFARARRGRTE